MLFTLDFSRPLVAPAIRESSIALAFSFFTIDKRDNLIKVSPLVD